MSLLAVNFHYVRPIAVNKFESIYPATPERLKNQLEELSRHFEFLSGLDLLQLEESGSPLPSNALVITFDDGLREQFEVALPILDSLHIPALFFASPKPALMGKALGVHKIHFVRENIAPKLLKERIEAQISARGQTLLQHAGSARETYRYDNEEQALLKWCLNFVLSPQERDTLIDDLFLELVGSEAEWSHQLYMDVAQMNFLHERKYLGNHCWDHLPLATLDAQNCREQMDKVKNAFIELNGGYLPFISYPIGSAAAVTRREAEIASELGYRIGFTTEKAVNTNIKDPLLLARVSDTDVLGGNHSQMLVEHGVVNYKKGIQKEPTRYFV